MAALLVATSLGLGAWLWSHDRPRARPAAAGATAATEQGATREDLMRMRQEIEALKRNQSAVPPTRQAMPAASAEVSGPQTFLPPEATQQPNLETIRAQQQARRESARARMDFQLESEPRDRSFERTVEEQLHATYAVPELAGTRFASLECRSTLCRVTSQHESREAMRKFTRNAAKHAPFQGEVFYTYGEGETPTSTLFFSRPGAALPHDF